MFEHGTQVQYEYFNCHFNALITVALWDRLKLLKDI